MSEKDGSQVEVWVTPDQIKKHLKKINDKADLEYQEKYEKCLCSEIDSAQIQSSKKH